MTRQGNGMGVAHERRPRIHVYRVVHVPPGVAGQQPMLVKARSGEGAVKTAAEHLGVPAWTIRLDDYGSAA